MPTSSIISRLSVICLLTFLIACKKHTAQDLQPVEIIPVASIDFTSPIPGAVYFSGDSITIIARAISTEDIHGYDIIIKKQNDATQYYEEFIHDHNDTLFINKKWKNTVTVPTDLEVTVSLLLDHDGHTYKRSVNVKAE